MFKNYEIGFIENDVFGGAEYAELSNHETTELLDIYHDQLFHCYLDISTENMKLCSINRNIYVAAKVWFIINPKNKVIYDIYTHDEFKSSNK
jgi:hypothetical protein